MNSDEAYKQGYKDCLDYKLCSPPDTYDKYQRKSYRDGWNKCDHFRRELYGDNKYWIEPEESE